MRIIRPTTIIGSMLVSSDVPETDAAEWTNGATYLVGNTVIYNHVIYECVLNNTNKSPPLYVSGVSETVYWIDRGATNRWKMFDAKVGSKTQQSESITVELAPGLIDSAAFLDLTATEIEFAYTDPIDGLVYSETIDLINKSVIVDAYTYFFEPIIMSDAAVILGLPPYSNATLTITISNPGGVAEIGTLAVGMQTDLGLTQYDPTISITSYSKKTVDEFGVYSVIRRGFSKRMSCEFVFPNSQLDAIAKTLSEYDSELLVWIGADAGYSSMIIYGFFKAFTIAVPYPLDSKCNIEIEGLST